MLNKTSGYQIKLNKAIVGGVRNFDCYYIVIREEGNPTKYISKAMRNDEDNEDYVKGEIQIKPTSVQLWNYDKMKIIQSYPVDFKHQPNFIWSNYQENIELSVIQIPPQTKFNNKANTQPANGQVVEVQKVKVGSLKNIQVSNMRKDKSKVQQVNPIKEFLSSNAVPPQPKLLE